MKPVLHGFTLDGADARLHLCVEGELIGFLLLEVPRPIVARSADGALLFTVHLRSFFGTRGHVTDAKGAVLARLKHTKREYFAVDAAGAELTRFSEAAEGVLTGAHGELIVRPVPVENEAVSVTFATPDVRLRAAMLGLAVLYDYVHD